MKFGYVILYVDDVEAAIAFYEKAFGLARGMLAETGEYGELATGESKLAFAHKPFVQSSLLGPIELADGAGRAPPMEIALVADDVAAAYTRAVESGAEAVKPPELKPWGQTVAYVRDNHGFLVELCSAIH